MIIPAAKTVRKVSERFSGPSSTTPNRKRNLTGWKAQADTSGSQKRGRVDGIFKKKPGQ